MSSSADISPLSALLQTATIKGEPAAEGARVADMRSAWSIYKSMWYGDQYSALNRARMELMMAGYPPYDPEMLRLTGQEGIANINTGIMKTYLTEACLPLLDQLNTVEKYINIEVKHKEGDETDWEDAKSVVEDEHYTMLQNEPTFAYRKIELIRQMVMHGVSVPYFPDSYDWRWRSEPIGEFLIPHMTPANEESVEVACIVRSRNPHELAKYLEDGSKNWNKDEIKQALIDARPRTLKQNEWERAVSMWKGNDLWLTSQADEITTVEEFVRELNGKITHYIFREDGGGNDYLYKNVGRFESQSQCFMMFTLDIATDGFYHSIRGLGSEALPIVQEINRVFSAFMDAMRLSSKMALQAEDEDALQNLTFIEHSGFLLLPTGVKQAERPMPNIGSGIVQGLDYLSNMLNRKMGHFASDATFSDYKRRTKAEVMAKVQQLASMGEGNADLLNQNWDRLIKEQFRRIMRGNFRAEEPGGEQVKKFKKRCEDRGVPKEFWDMIDLDRCHAERAVGAGSAAQQIMVVERLMEAMEKGFFDARGEFEFKKDYVRLFTNKEKAIRYVGEMDKQRPLQDEKNAGFENDIMSSGKPVQIYDNDNNSVHAKVHIGESNAEQPTASLSDDLNTLNQAVMQNNEDQILELVPAMIQKHTHAAEHVERMKDDAKAPEFRQKLQQIGGVIENAQKKMIKIQEDRAKKAQEQGGQDPKAQQEMMKTQALQQKQNMALEHQIAEAQFKLKSREEEHRQKLAQEDELHQKKMQDQDEEASQKLALDHAEKVSAFQNDIA